MGDDLTCVNVTEGALVKFIERVAVAGGSDIKVSQGDRGWYVTYRPPFTRDIKADAAEEYVLPKNERLDAAGPLGCQSCINIKACKQMYVESGTWPEILDCFVPDRTKHYPQFEMDSCKECTVVPGCLALYDLDREHWKCIKGKVHLNFTELHDVPCSPQMIAEADCEGDKDKCGDVCHAKY